jgi:hypothetical protein
MSAPRENYMELIISELTARVFLRIGLNNAMSGSETGIYAEKAFIAAPLKYVCALTKLHGYRTNSPISIIAKFCIMKDFYAYMPVMTV